jgi:hypothetical protein
MRKTSSNWFISAGALMLALCCAPAVMAAPGETSGPAAGTKTIPGAAAQKNDSTQNGSSAAGAPGVAGKQGAESGAKPSASDGRQSTAH